MAQSGLELFCSVQKWCREADRLHFTRLRLLSWSSEDPALLWNEDRYIKRAWGTCVYACVSVCLFVCMSLCVCVSAHVQACRGQRSFFRLCCLGAVYLASWNRFSHSSLGFIKSSAGRQASFKNSPESASSVPRLQPRAYTWLFMWVLEIKLSSSCF